MLEPEALSGEEAPSANVTVERMEQCPPSLWRHLYAEVGRDYHWVDRLAWTDDEIERYLGDPALELWILAKRAEPPATSSCDSMTTERSRSPTSDAAGGHRPGTGKVPADASGGARVGARRQPRVAPHLVTRSRVGAAELSRARVQYLEAGNVPRYKQGKRHKAQGTRHKAKGERQRAGGRVRGLGSLDRYALSAAGCPSPMTAPGPSRFAFAFCRFFAFCLLPSVRRFHLAALAPFGVEIAHSNWS